MTIATGISLVITLAATSASSSILTALLFLFLLGLAAAALLSIASKVFYVWEDPRIEAVEYCLPGANCGGCGYPGCAACAAAIVKGEAEPTACVAGGSDVAVAVGKVLGREVDVLEPRFAVPHNCGRVCATDKYYYEGAQDCRAQTLLFEGNKSCPFSCLGLGTCTVACMFDAVKMGSDEIPVVDVEKCKACGKCEDICPKHAIYVVSESSRRPFAEKIEMEDKPLIEAVKEMVEKHRGELGAILSTLEDVQEEYGYLPPTALKTVSRETGHPLEDLYAIATFFKAFSITPRGEHLVSICMGTACHVRGAAGIAEEFEIRLGIKAGCTTEDMKYTLETVNCLGACALGPVVVVDGRYFPNVKRSEVEKIIKKTEEGLGGVDVTKDDKIFPIKLECPNCGVSLVDAAHEIDGHPSIKLEMQSKKGKGWARLSSLYGSYSHETEHPIEDGEVVTFSCPNCHKEMTSVANCAVCGAHMLLFKLEDRGTMQVCSRRGCKEHLLDVTRPEIVESK